MLLTLSCGGVSHRDGSSDNSDARGGAAGLEGVAGASAADNGGAAGALSGGAFGAAGSAESLCAPRPSGCDTSATYVDVSDTTTVRLAYPNDASSDTNNDACPILATGVASCGLVHLSFSACSSPGGDGVCLDTASTEPHYTDASGMRWTMLTLSGSSSQLQGGQAEGMVDLELVLARGSESTYRELAVHAHVCAVVSGILTPCK